MMFKLFKKGSERSDEKNMNRLWDRYADGRLEKENYGMYVLCDYDGGVNGEGHSGFFFNNEAVLPHYTAELSRILPPELYENYLTAYHSYGTDSEDEVCEQADQFFYAHEQQIIDIEQKYANLTFQ